MGERVGGCPWWAFRSADVVAVLRAHDWFPACGEWWGADPEWWLVEGVQHYHRQLDRARADAIKVAASRTRPRVPRLPPGFALLEEIRG